MSVNVHHSEWCVAAVVAIAVVGVIRISSPLGFFPGFLFLHSRLASYLVVGQSTAFIDTTVGAANRPTAATGAVTPGADTVAAREAEEDFAQRLLLLRRHAEAYAWAVVEAATVRNACTAAVLHACGRRERGVGGRRCAEQRGGVRNA